MSAQCLRQIWRNSNNSGCRPFWREWLNVKWTWGPYFGIASASLAAAAWGLPLLWYPWLHQPIPSHHDLSLGPLVRHQLLSRRQLSSLLLRVLLFCLGPARRPPPMICSRLTCWCPRRRVLLLRCPQLGRLSWPVLNLSICQCHRTRTFHRSCCHRIGFARICMWPGRTSTPCPTLHPYRMVICLRSRRPRLGDRHPLPRSGMPSLSIVPVLVRRPRRCCRSPTELLISRSWHPHRLLIRWGSSSTRIPRPIGSGFPNTISRPLLCMTPRGPGLAVFHQGPHCTGCPACDPRPSGW